MSTCARCGLPDSECGAWQQENRHIIACRDRQIAAQAALLRSVTRYLEIASEHLDTSAEEMPDRNRLAKELVDKVLEWLA